MEEEITGLKSLLRSLAEASMAEGGPHLTLEKLVAYHFKKLTADEASRTQDHLVMCRECTSDLLDLTAFCLPEEDRGGRTEGTEMEIAWGEFQAQLQTIKRPSDSGQQSKPSLIQRLRAMVPPFRMAYAMAALLLVLSLSLAFWVRLLNQEKQDLIAQLNQRQHDQEVTNSTIQNARAESAREIEGAKRQADASRNRAEHLEEEFNKVREEVDRLQKPEVNVPIRNLLEGDPGVRSGTHKPDAAEQLIVLPTDAVRFTLIIPSPSSVQYSRAYTIKITNHRRATVLALTGLRAEPEVGFTINLPCRLFPEGAYLFSVYGPGPETRHLVTGSMARIKYKRGR